MVSFVMAETPNTIVLRVSGDDDKIRSARVHCSVDSALDSLAISLDVSSLAIPLHLDFLGLSLPAVCSWCSVCCGSTMFCSILF